MATGCGLTRAGATIAVPAHCRGGAIPPARSVIIDGEAVYCGSDGKPDFDKLHSAAYDHQAFLYAFDLLELNGEDYRDRPLEQRKAKLAKLLARSEGMRFSEHLKGDGAIVFEHACKLGLEGIVSKWRDFPYRSGRVKSWIKTKNPASPGDAADTGRWVVRRNTGQAPVDGTVGRGS